MMISGDQEVILLKASLSTGLYLHIIVEICLHDDSEEEKELLYVDHRPAKGSGRYARDHEREGGDF